MSRIKGITVVLLQKIEIGKDLFGSPIYENREIEVENILVAQPTTDDVTNSLNLYGKKIVYLLGIPKGDMNIWEDTEVVFFGKKFRTFGAEIQGIENIIPLDWNKKIMVERYD